MTVPSVSIKSNDGYHRESWRESLFHWYENLVNFPFTPVSQNISLQLVITSNSKTCSCSFRYRSGNIPGRFHKPVTWDMCITECIFKLSQRSSLPASPHNNFLILNGPDRLLQFCSKFWTVVTLNRHSQSETCKSVANILSYTSMTCTFPIMRPAKLLQVRVETERPPKLFSVFPFVQFLNWNLVATYEVLWTIWNTSTASSNRDIPTSSEMDNP